MNPADGPWSDAARGATALGRFAMPAEIAALVAFLAGPENGYVTGAVLNVDYGYAALAGLRGYGDD